MRVIRHPQAARHTTAGESDGVHTLMLQHRITGWPGPFSVGTSHLLPDSGVDLNPSTSHVVYVVVTGDVEVSGTDATDTESIGPMGSVSVAPGERLRLRNDTNSVAMVLVIEQAD